MLCPWFLRRLCVASFPVAPITQCSPEETLPAGLPWETNTGKIHWLPCRTSTFLLCCSASQSCSTFATPWTEARQDSLSITNSQSLLKLMSIESVMPFNHLIICHPLLLQPSILPPSLTSCSNCPPSLSAFSLVWTASLYPPRPASAPVRDTGDILAVVHDLPSCLLWWLALCYCLVHVRIPCP